MARVNVEDEWFSDPVKRREALIEAVRKLSNVKPAWIADGMALDAWRLAQRFWKNGGKLIPEDVWARSGLEPLIDCDLASREPDGIYVRGTKAQHEWIRQRVEAGVARHATADRDPKGRFVQRPTSESPATAGEPLDESPATVQREPARNQRAVQPLTPALTLTPPLETKRPKGLSPQLAPGGARGVPRFGTGDMELAGEWAEHARGLMPRLKVDLDKWADSIRLLREQDGLTLDQVREVFEFVRTDDFWRTNAISPQAIRSRSKNGLRKVENIRLRMQQVAGEKPAIDWDKVFEGGGQ